MELQPCASCRRHVAEAVCPFCGHGVEHVHRDPILGRLSRAAVFGAATLVACGGSKPRTNDQKVEKNEVNEREVRRRPPCMTPDPKRVEELEKQLAEAKDDTERARIQSELDYARTPVCAPYGAPPARRRSV